MDLCDLISKHPEKITSLRTEPIIRGGLRKFTDEVPAAPAGETFDREGRPTRGDLAFPHAPRVWFELRSTLDADRLKVFGRPHAFRLSLLCRPGA